MIRFRIRAFAIATMLMMLVMLLTGLMLHQTATAKPGKDSAFVRSLGDAFANYSSARADDALSIRTLFNPGGVLAGGEVELLLQITVDKGSYIYSVEGQGAYSPNPTHLELQLDGLLSPKGRLKESPPETVFDGPFNRPLRVHKRIFTISQKFRVEPGVRPGLYRVSGALKFHICDGEVCSILKGKSFQAELRVVAGGKLP